MFIPDGRIEPDSSRLTYFDITDIPPTGAAWARLQFSKGMGENADIIEIDQIILTPVGTTNLVRNPSFELGLTGWTTTIFNPLFEATFEGAATVTAIANGALFQDVPITNLPVTSSFLLSFAVFGHDIPTLSVKVLWLNAKDVEIGTGLDLSIPTETLSEQRNYLTYLDITNPAPAGTVKARILFTATVPEFSSLRIDQVILARVSTPNLVQNPSFKNGLSGWTTVNTAAFITDLAYEGKEVARVGDGGGLIFQDVPITLAAGHCFVLNFGLGYRRPDTTIFSGHMLVKVIWLDKSGSDFGLGLSLFIPGFAPNRGQWLVYTGITEPAPQGAVTARIQFTKFSGGTGGVIDIDKVVLGRLV